jgi:hypothetical protein
MLPSLIVARVTHRRKPIRERVVTRWDRRRPLPPYAPTFCENLARSMQAVLPITRPGAARPMFEAVRPQPLTRLNSLLSLQVSCSEALLLYGESLIIMPRGTIEQAQAAVRAAAGAAQAAEGTKAAGQKCRAFFAAWERLLGFYAPLPSASAAPRPLPPELAAMLKGLFGYLAVGQIPGPIADCRRRGRAALGPEERRDLSVAVAYIDAARRGAVADAAPVKTIMQAYGVSRRTVQVWQNTVPPARNVSARMLESLVSAAGRRYRSAGRSQAAIARRARKRSGRSGRAVE